MNELTADKMRTAFSHLAKLLPRPLTLIVGGGGAMLLAYRFPLVTADVDAVPKGLSIEELDPLIKKVALELDLPGDWLNPWYSSFTHVLAEDFESRLVEVFNEKGLRVMALGKEDLLLMKSFAHRQKDIPHARALVRGGADIEAVFDRIEVLKKRKIPHAKEAFDFLENIIEMEDG